MRISILGTVILGLTLFGAACSSDDDDSSADSDDSAASSYQEQMEEELDTLSDLMNDVDEMASDIASAEDPDQAVNDLLAKAQEVSAQTGVVSALEPDLPEFEEADTAIEEAVATLDLSMAALQTGLEPGGTVEDINLSGELLDDATEMMAEARALFDDAG